MEFPKIEYTQECIVFSDGINKTVMMTKHMVDRRLGSFKDQRWDEN